MSYIGDFNKNIVGLARQDPALFKVPRNVFDDPEFLTPLEHW